MIFLVTGHRRGGTTYTASLFRKLGYDVQHERWGRNGICAWAAAVAMSRHTDIQWGGGGQVRYPWHPVDRVVHIVRSPWRTICSTIGRDWTIRSKVLEGDADALSRSPWSFVGRYVNTGSDDIFDMAVMGFVGWHKLIHALGPDVVLRMEEIDQTLPEWIASLGLPVACRDVDLERAEWEMDEKHERLKSEFLAKYPPSFIHDHCSVDVVEELREFCMTYGYDPETFDWRT